jgi:hypothetical protein
MSMMNGHQGQAMQYLSLEYTWVFTLKRGKRLSKKMLQSVAVTNMKVTRGMGAPLSQSGSSYPLFHATDFSKFINVYFYGEMTFID